MPQQWVETYRKRVEMHKLAGRLIIVECAESTKAEVIITTRRRLGNSAARSCYITRRCQVSAAHHTTLHNVYGIYKRCVGIIAPVTVEIWISRGLVPLLWQARELCGFSDNGAIVASRRRGGTLKKKKKYTTVKKTDKDFMVLKNAWNNRRY